MPVFLMKCLQSETQLTFTLNVTNQKKKLGSFLKFLTTKLRIIDKKKTFWKMVVFCCQI